MEAAKRKRTLSGDLIEVVILAYLVLCIVWHTLSPIIPFITLSYRLHLTWISSFLLYTGIGLTAADLFLSRNLRRGPHVFLLHGICGIAILSSLLHGKYGYAANFRTIAWMMIVFSLFYSSTYRIRRRRFLTFLLIVYIVVFAIWFTASCLSLYQFTHLISNDPPQKAASLWLSGYGFYKNRLYGVFAYPEYGAVTGLLLMITSGYLFCRIRLLPARTLIVLLNIPFFWYLVLSGSRNAMVSLYATVFIGAFLIFRFRFLKSSLSTNRIPQADMPGKSVGNRKKHLLLSLSAALAALAVVHLLYNGTLGISEKIPSLFMEKESGVTSSIPDNSAAACILAPVRNLADKSAAAKAAIENSFSTREFSKPASSEKESTNTTGKDTKKEDTKKSKSKNKKNTEDEQEESLLSRKDVQHNPGTFRLEIWTEYLKLYKDIGLFGLSPENSSKYIQEHYPDFFIVDYIRRAYPEDYAAGYVFHPHSGYLKVFASTGFFGIFLLLAYIFLCGSNIFFYLLRIPCPSPGFLFSFLVVFAGALTAVFDSELFFVFNPSTFLFWLALSLMYRCMSAYVSGPGTAASGNKHRGRTDRRTNQRIS